MKYALSIALLALPAAALSQQQEPAPEQKEQPKAEEKAPAAGGPQAVAAADLVSGAEVRGPDGAVVGRIEEPDGDGAIVSTGRARARLPLDNFRKNGRGLMIGVNRAQFEASVNRPSS